MNTSFLHFCRKRFLSSFSVILALSAGLSFETNFLANISCKYYGIANAPADGTNQVARIIIEQRLYEEPPHNPLLGLRIFDFSSNELPYSIQEGSIFATNVLYEKDFFQRGINKKVECIFKTMPYPLKAITLQLNQNNLSVLDYELYGRSSFNEGWSLVAKGKMMPLPSSEKQGTFYEIEGTFSRRFPQYRLMLCSTNNPFFRISMITLHFVNYEVLFYNRNNRACVVFLNGTKAVEPSYSEIQAIAAVSKDHIDLWSISSIQQNEEFLKTLKDKPLWQSPERLFRLGIAFTAFILVWVIIRTKRSVAKMERDLR